MKKTDCLKISYTVLNRSYQTCNFNFEAPFKSYLLTKLFRKCACTGIRNMQIKLTIGHFFLLILFNENYAKIIKLYYNFLLLFYVGYSFLKSIFRINLLNHKYKKYSSNWSPSKLLTAKECIPISLGTPDLDLGIDLLPICFNIIH